MYLDDYDPFAIKLYSRCARSQAQKFSHKKMSYSNRRPKSSITLSQEKDKKKKSLCTFDMCQSRQQRERKYKRILTPAVGQYNPKTQGKAKLTWDILKIYNNRTHSRKTQNSIKMQFTKQQIKTQNCLVQPQQTPIGAQTLQGTTHDLLRDTQVTSQNGQNFNKSTPSNSSPKKAGHYVGSRLKSQSNRYRTIRSQVDMSRMTGRQDTKHYETEGLTSELEVSKSIEFIKNKKSHTIDFQKQLSREKIQSLTKPINVPSDYAYDISIIKPKWSKIASFGQSVGRDPKTRMLNSQVYGYTHYDYDKYVWGAKSNVFANTKTHMIDFKKQTNRNRADFRRS